MSKIDSIQSMPFAQTVLPTKGIGIAPEDDAHLKQLRYKEAQKIYHTDTQAPAAPLELQPLTHSNEAIASPRSGDQIAIDGSQQQAESTCESIACDELEDTPLSNTPKLAKPKNHGDKFSKLLAQFNQNIALNKVLNAEDGTEGSDSESGEKLFYELMVNTVKDLMRAKEQQQLTNKDIAISKQEELMEMQKKHRELTQKILNGENLSDIAGKVALASGIAIGVTTAASALLFIASFFTAGATLPAALAALKIAISVIGGVSSITEGSAQIFKADRDHKNSVLTGEMKESKCELEINTKQVEEAMKAQYTAMDDVLRLLKMAFAVSSSHKAATRAVLSASAA